MAVRPLERESVSANKVVALELKATCSVVPGRRIATADDIGFTAADGAGTCTTEMFKREELLQTIGPREGEFVSERRNSSQLQALCHGAPISA